MRPQWSKVFRDLRQNGSRSILVIVAIAVGVCGFGSLLSTYSILTRELNAGYLATNPASATLFMDRIDDDLLNNVRTFSGIGELEARRMISARLRVGENDWRNAFLFVIPDFHAIHVSRLNPEKGKWPPADGEILVERDALGVAHASIGDTVVIKTSKGTEQRLRITGSVHDVGQAQARMEQIVYGYITIKTLAELGESPYLDQLKVIVAENKFNEQHIRTILEHLKPYVESKGYTVKRVEIPTPGKHPHANLMGMLLLFQSSFGLFALLLSGILVLNLLSSVMAGEVRQIGIMKATGARRAQIARIYFGEVLLLSSAALAVAMPFSIFAGRAIAVFMSRFLNFDLQSLAVSPWVFALEAAVGFLVPFFAAIYPVWKGSRISVREAITDYGIQQSKFGTGKIDRVISRIGGLKRPLLLSLRNTFRRRGRVALTLGTLVAGGTIFISAWNVRASFVHTIDLMFRSLQFDVALTLADPYPVETVESIVRKIPGVSAVESWSSAEATPVYSDGSRGDPFRIAGIPPGSKRVVLNIVDGRNLQLKDENSLVINSRLSNDEPKMRVGDKVLLRFGDREQWWRVVGICREAFAGPVAYANYAPVALVGNQAGQTRNVRIVTAKHDRESVNAVKQSLEKALADAGLKATGVTGMADRRRVFDEHNSVIYDFLIGMAFLIVIVGGLGLMTVMSISVLERRRELGVLRAIGANRKAILFLILVEGSFIGALSWVLSIIPSFLVSRGLGNLVAGMMFHTNLDSAIDPLGMVTWLLLTLLFGAAASFIPAWNASRLTVHQLVEYE